MLFFFFCFDRNCFCKKKQKRVIMTAMGGHQGRLLLNSEVNWVERCDLILN